MCDRIGMFEKDSNILLPDNKSEVSDAFLKMTTRYEAEMESGGLYIIMHYEK